ncbi:MAG: hypothetical protein ABSA85_12315 [Terracidiphilus sp.]|jgi:hypothetical protein
MQSKVIPAFILLAATVSAIPALAQSAPAPPCLASEKPPLSTESNPTTRDPLVIHSEGGTNSRTVIGEACLVLGPQQKIRPGQGYAVPSFGLYFDWALALVGDGGRFVAVQGTVSRTGPINQGGPKSLAMPLALGWNFYPNQPNPSTNKLFTQVAVFPCQDDSTPTCTPDGQKEIEVTRLLGSPDTTNKDYTFGGLDEKKFGPGCLRPINGTDPELRQLTITTVDNSYVIFACLVSDKYPSLVSAGFTVQPLDASGNAASITGGNTRANVGPLYQNSTKAPKFVSILAVQVSSLASLPAVVKGANVGVQYEWCPNDDPSSPKCVKVNETPQSPLNPNGYKYPYRIEFYP